MNYGKSGNVPETCVGTGATPQNSYLHGDVDPHEVCFFLKWKGYEEKGTGKRARKLNTWKLSWLRKRRKHLSLSASLRKLRVGLAPSV